MSLVILWTFDYKQYAAESASKANFPLVSQEVSGISEQRKFSIMFKKRLSLVPILSHINAVHILKSYL